MINDMESSGLGRWEDGRSCYGVTEGRRKEIPSWQNGRRPVECLHHRGVGRVAGVDQKRKIRTFRPPGTMSAVLGLNLGAITRAEDEMGKTGARKQGGGVEHGEAGRRIWQRPCPRCVEYRDCLDRAGEGVGVG